jgi:hypothetical protein
MAAIRPLDIAVYHGATPVDAVYHGGTRIWPPGTPLPPLTQVTGTVTIVGGAPNQVNVELHAPPGGTAYVDYQPGEFSRQAGSDATKRKVYLTVQNSGVPLFALNGQPAGSNEAWIGIHTPMLIPFLGQPPPFTMEMRLQVDSRAGTPLTRTYDTTGDVVLGVIKVMA